MANTGRKRLVDARWHRWGQMAKFPALPKSGAILCNTAASCCGLIYHAGSAGEMSVNLVASNHHVRAVMIN